ncbi:MAG: hypothetical protein OXC93_14620 [Rhodospirillaceae bacterium]|nr:hypothetical protein [Rhodospirillaceae bacterium]
MTKPVAMGGRFSTAGADFMSDGANVVFEVSQMGARLEVVAAAVGDYAAVGYMHLTHAPAIEA